jgi:hypothetical protein
MWGADEGSIPKDEFWLLRLLPEPIDQELVLVKEFVKPYEGLSSPKRVERRFQSAYS